MSSSVKLLSFPTYNLEISLKEKCKVLEKKEKIEDTKTFNLQQRIKEIEMMSFED